MKIHQIYTASELRNFTYLIELSDGTAISIDPWDEKLVNKLLIDKQLTLKAIINTHEHWDHIQGNIALVSEHDCEVWAHTNGQGKIPGLSRTLVAGEKIKLDSGVELQVLDTPGHTFAHLCFLVLDKSQVKAVFTGDTLFNAGVGHCRSGDAEVLYQTISKQFHSLADEVIVYPGHEYLENNLRFTLSLEPNNANAQSWLERALKYDPTVMPITTCIGDERQFNSFFRLDSPQIRERLNCQSASEEQVFVALRSLRDNW
jgi:hydroxyacylglutathione hydrolase